MRHRRLRRKLGVRTKHRKALLRNLVRGLVLHKRIQTTFAKAKEAGAFADKMVTLAKQEGLHARRLLIQKLACPDTVDLLIKQIAPHFKDRKGGYTRVLRLGTRVGDGAQVALLEFSTLIEAPEKPKKPKKEKEKKGKEVRKEEELPAEKPKKEKVKEVETKKADTSSEEKKEKEEKKESEKKGGFLGTLRRFLKGDEQ